jgi:hypothetical protein
MKNYVYVMPIVVCSVLFLGFEEPDRPRLELRRLSRRAASTSFEGV